MKGFLPLSATLSAVLNTGVPGLLEQGEALWKRVFDLGSDRLAFEALLQHEAGALKAKVSQTSSGQQVDIFDAQWLVEGNAWKFGGALADGAPLAEGRAIALFQDYVSALGVDAQTPGRAPIMRP